MVCGWICEGTKGGSGRVGDTWMLRRRLLQACLWASGTGRRVARHGREMFRAFVLHTGEGINALVDMIDVAFIWFVGSRALSVGFRAQCSRTRTGHALHCPLVCPVGSRGLMGWRSRRPSGHSRAINSIQACKAIPPLSWMTRWD